MLHRQSRADTKPSAPEPAQLVTDSAPAMVDRPLDIFLIAIGGTGMAPLACLLKELEYDLILPTEYAFVLHGLRPPYVSIMKTVTSVSPSSFYNGGLSFFAAPDLKSGSFAERSKGSTQRPNIQLVERCQS